MTKEKSRLCGMTQEEVDSYLKEKNISVSVMMEHGYDKDGDWAEEIHDEEGYFVKFGDDCVRTVKMWGFSSPNGFHTFSWEESKMTEAKAQYMTVLFHKLYEEYDVSWASAEALAFAYAMSDFDIPWVPIEKRLEPDMSEEELEEVRKKLLDPKYILPMGSDCAYCFVTGEFMGADVIDNGGARFTNEFDAWIGLKGQEILKTRGDNEAKVILKEWNDV